MIRPTLVLLALLSNPVELGTIEWHRGFDAALQEAESKNKPLLVLFQEVPG